MTKKELTIYSIENCSACVAAAKFLDSKGVAYKVVKIDEDMEAMRFIQRQGHRSFPQIYDGEDLFVTGGYAALRAINEAVFAPYK